MRIDRVSLEGFGRLTNQTFEFGSGFNLIFGLNETGKSTLQRAIVALLYGFYSPGRINATERAKSDMFRPWDETAPYAGSMEYTLTNGQSFRVTHGFENNATTSIYTLPENNDITSSFQKQSQGRVFFADDHLGMPREVFENTSYIRQAELIALNHSANAITDTLMRLSASAASDNTATSAITLIQNTHRDQVGTERARSKPLAQTRAKLSKLETERGQLLQRRRELASGLVEINQAKEEVDQLAQQVEKMRFLEAAASRAELQRKIDAVQQAAQAVEAKSAAMEEWADWADFPVQLRDEVLRLSDRYRTLQAECQGAKARADEATDNLRELTVNVATTQEKIGTLEGSRNTSSEELADLRKLANQWEMARQATQNAHNQWQEAQAALAAFEQQFSAQHRQSEPTVRLGYAGLAQLKQEWLHQQKQVREAEANLAEAQVAWSKTGMSEAEFQTLAEKVQYLQTTVVPVPESQRKKGCSKGCNLFASNRPTQPTSIPVQPEIQIFQDIEPILLTLITARNDLKTAQGSFDDNVAHVCQITEVSHRTSLDESFFDDLNQRLTQLQALEATLNQQRKAVENLAAGLNEAQKKEFSAETNLKTRLNALGLDTEDWQQAVDDYAQMSEKKAALDRAEAELKNLQLQAQAQEQKIEQWQQKQTQLDAVGSELQKVLAQAEVDFHIEDAATVDAALAGFEQRFENHNQWASAQQQFNLAVRDLQNLDGLAGLESSLAELDTLLDQIRTAQPQFAHLQVNEPPGFYTTQLNQLGAALNDAKNRMRDLKSSASQTGNNRRHLAEIDEEITQAKDQLQRLEWFGARLKQAENQLTEATSEFQKQFAPKLENLMGGGLIQITRGRYPNIHVDPTSLSVSVTAPEIDQPVSAEALSTGTRELVYLMLRVSVARLMSRTGEQLPLLLDDPLVQSDRGRQEQTLAYLSQLAEEMQVFLFTKDEWVRDWVTNKISNQTVTRVHILG